MLEIKNIDKIKNISMDGTNGELIVLNYVPSTIRINPPQYYFFSAEIVGRGMKDSIIIPFQLKREIDSMGRYLFWSPFQKSYFDSYHLTKSNLKSFNLVCDEMRRYILNLWRENSTMLYDPFTFNAHHRFTGQPVTMKTGSVYVGDESGVPLSDINKLLSKNKSYAQKESIIFEMPKSDKTIVMELLDITALGTIKRTWINITSRLKSNQLWNKTKDWIKKH